MTQQQPQQQLLPCPFCGTVPRMTGPWEIGTSDTYEAVVECPGCEAQISRKATSRHTVQKTVEEIWNIRSQAPEKALQRQVDDMALLIRRLVHSLNKSAPGHERAKAALDYLKRHGLQGSPLRTTTQEQST